MKEKKEKISSCEQPAVSLETAMEAPSAERKTSFLNKHRDACTATIIMAPMALWWAVVSGIPLIFAFGLGFFDWKIVTEMPEFVGLKNFIAFFTDTSYLMDLWRTVWIGTLSTAVTIIGGFIIGLLLNLPIKLKGLYRTMWYLPAVTSTVAVTQVLAILLIPGQGINGLMEKLGLEQIVLDTSFFWSVVAIILFSFWRGVGSNAILWLAGLQSIEPVLYEAAEIDGANGMQKLLNITMPGLRPMATYVIVTSIIAALQIYEPVAFISRGGPNSQTRVLTLRILEDAYKNFNFGMAGASGLVLAIVIFTCSITYYVFSLRSMRKGEAA